MFSKQSLRDFENLDAAMERQWLNHLDNLINPYEFRIENTTRKNNQGVRQ